MTTNNDQELLIRKVMWGSRDAKRHPEVLTPEQILKENNVPLFPTNEKHFFKAYLIDLDSVWCDERIDIMISHQDNRCIVAFDYSGRQFRQR